MAYPYNFWKTTLKKDERDNFYKGFSVLDFVFPIQNVCGYKCRPCGMLRR